MIRFQASNWPRIVKAYALREPWRDTKNGEDLRYWGTSQNDVGRADDNALWRF